MKVTVSLFAMFRERAGRDTVELDVAEGSTVADALRGLADQHAALAPLIASMPMVMAVNRVYAEPATVLRADDELALIPPVSGGAALPAISDRASRSRGSDARSCRRG